MTWFQRALLILLVLAVLLAAWMGRYSLVTSTRAPLILDRWTGAVRIPAITDAP